MRQLALKFAGLAVLLAILAAGTAWFWPAATSAPAPQRAAIDCRNFPAASSCGYGVANYTGDLLGRAEYCSLSEDRVARLRRALHSALAVLSNDTTSIPGLGLVSESERRSSKRARFKLVPIDCVVVERDLLELMHELGIRPSLEDDLEPRVTPSR